MCTPYEMTCVKNITIFENDCQNRCEGLYITSFERREIDKDKLEAILSIVEYDYELYKAGGFLKFSNRIGGNF